ncbi:Gfo/Idh/MocA family protein [Streptosporangium sp. 'caverna']|uniref:Gfo/Idh/MocA family protein n=1 Tax=Streptosporangium sp. 'caverna' TaxID=2202249 RepID=UPI000D7D4FDA|nr:Gfo/Idh/MocA family oxidoreductase [Streptosporangium sp. 'caverna']AWS45079.1 dehydrogenase [Streptosporangium sp. 'caverna']
MTLSVGLVGCGNISRSHLRGYLSVPDEAVVTAVADVDLDAATERARQAGGAQVFGSYERMLDEAPVDAVDICLPHHLHADAIIAAAKAGKHILCEKPLCLTIAEAERIADAVSTAGVTLMCAHNQLTLPAVAHARELIESGALGRVYELRTTDSFFNDFDPSTMGWRAHAATSGGGELIDTGYHPTYLLLYLASARPAAVTAMLSTHRLAFMEGEDSARVLVRFAGGAVGEVVTSWAYEAAPFTEKFSVVGELGSLWSDGTTLCHKPRGGAVTTVEFPAVDSIPAVCADFVRRIGDRSRPVHTHEEGTDVLKIILAAYRSAQEKREISL